MLRTCCAYTCLLICLTGFAQSHYVDSLQRIVDRSQADTLTVDALVELGREFIFISKEKSLQYTADAMRMATSLHYERGIASAYRNMAGIYSISGYYFASLIYVNKALALFNAHNDLLGEGNCYVTMANTYRRLGAYETSIDYHQKAYQIFRSLNHAEREAITAHNLGQVYLDIGDIEKAESLARLSLQKLDSLNLKTPLTAAHRLWGEIEVAKNNFAKAEEHFIKALSISDELKDLSQKDATVKSLIGLARLYRTQNRPADEARIIFKAMPLAKESQDAKDLRELYRIASDFHTRSGNYKLGYQFLNDYLVYMDSVERERPKEVLTLMQALQSTFESEVNFEKLKTEKMAQQQKLDLRNTQFLYSTISLIILFVTTVLLIVYVRDKRKTNQELRILNETKTKFFTIVAHDLKAPLNSLLSFSSLISRHAESLTAEEIKVMGQKLQESVGNSLKMTENLMMWARSQMNDYSVKPVTVNLKQVVEEILIIFNPIAIQKRIKMKHTIDEGIYVLADYDHIGFVMRNLINNAIKFTGENGTIVISAEVGNDMVQIAVTDSGVGMEKEQLDKLFDLEKKTSTTGTAGEKGTGLGLRLCKEFLEKNNGTIRAVSQPGKGTTFLVQLPLAKPMVGSV